MSSNLQPRINARTVVLDATHQRAEPTGEAPEPGAGRLCANPSCVNLVAESWEETGTLCARCAIEEDLFDREGRRDRAFTFDVV